MWEQDPHQPPQPSSKALEAGFHLLPPRPTLNTANSSSSFATSATSSSTSSSTLTAAPSIAKKRKWYKPRLKLNLHKDRMWVGFIRAGRITPIERDSCQNGKDDDEEGWEQLPAYAPPEEEMRETTREESGESGLDGLVVEPRSDEQGQGRRDVAGSEPPAYR